MSPERQKRQSARAAAAPGPRLLVAVDGSPSSLGAVRHAARRARDHPGLELHLLNVQPPMPSAIASFLSPEALRGYHEDEGRKALAAARAVVDEAGLRAESHIAIGPVAETIVDYAAERGCAEIVMGCRGLGAIPGLLLGSTTTKVLHLSDAVVTLVK